MSDQHQPRRLAWDEPAPADLYDRLEEPTMTTTTAPLYRLSPVDRTAAVRKLVRDTPDTSRGKLAMVTYQTTRGASEPRTIRTELVGIAKSATYGADSLLVRGAELYVIPLTVLISIDPAQEA